MSAVVVALAPTNSNNNLLPLSGLHTALNTGSSSSISITSSPERLTSANCHAPSNTICRVIAIDDEESRECPSQGASEIARDDVYNLGVDARGGVVCPTQQTTRHVLYTTTGVHNRRVGLPGDRVVLNDTAFIERRDCNSFDSIDGTFGQKECFFSIPDVNLSCSKQHLLSGDCHWRHLVDPNSHTNFPLLSVYKPFSFTAVDACVNQLRNSYLGKHHQQLPSTTSATAMAHQWGQQHQQLAMSAALAVEAARRKSLAASTTTGADDSKNKRKTPSPVMGIEPAPVSAEPFFDNSHDEDESMDMEEDEAHYHSSPTIQQSHGCHESDDDVTRRVSLSPISRRLALQFDSISFYSPVRPSTKRRKTFDTSAICP